MTPKQSALNRIALFAVALVGASLAKAQQPYVLPTVSVYSPRVANQTPVAGFAMPVSALQFEPRVDVQGRNFAEAQADISIRGGLFENTGFKLGALALFDPQTGHYFAELPVAPAMLGAPRVLTGAENARDGFNAEVGTVAYDWSPISPRGELAVSAGNYSSNRQNLYQGWIFHETPSGYRLGADAEVSRSQSDGSVPFGDHQFERFSARLQARGPHSQTDLFFGRQRKFFGWPNLYTPFGFNETEYLKTDLHALNHRAWTSPDSYWQVGAYYRRNYDDYEFNRAVPGASNPFIHTTRVRSIGLDGRHAAADSRWALGYSAQYLSDHLESTSLTAGRFNERKYLKLALVPEYSVDSGAGQWTLKGGAVYDDTDRDDSALSPVMEIAWCRDARSRFYLQYAESTQVATYTALNSSATSGLFRGNPNLPRESSRNLELGTELTWDRVTVQAAWFHRWDDELVDWTYRQGVTARTANPVDIGTMGLEMVAVAKFAHCDLVLGYTYLEKSADYGSAAVDASFYALNFPRHRLTVAMVARLPAGLELRLDNEYRVQEKNSLRVIGGDEAFISGVGLHYLPARVPGLEFSVRMDNVWDSDFQEVPGVPAARRQYAAGVGYRW